MGARVYRDPVLDTVIHRERCKWSECPRCTKAPVSKRDATKQEMGRLSYAANQRYREHLAAAAELLQNAEGGALERPASVTK